jgi:hypothetical protein
MEKAMKKTLFALLPLMLAASVVFAGSVKEYSADMVDVKSGRVTQRIAVMPDKVYSETFGASGKREAAVILRMDQKKMIMLMEQNKSYMELPFNKDQFTTSDLAFGVVEVKREKLGTETVSGYSASKYRITSKAMGMTVTVLQWMAPEFDMPLRTESQGNIQEMRNIKTGRPDAALFEMPKGYTRDKAMEEMMKGLMGGK